MSREKLEINYNFLPKKNAKRLRKIVIPAAGLGTRLLPSTKEQPKEMLPLFAEGVSGGMCLKPMLHLIFEQLYDKGFREFCFIVGRGKRSIEDYFTIDNNYLLMLNSKGKDYSAKELEVFYEKINNSVIIYINQSEPKGFGNAVLTAKPFVGDDMFLVHAGDSFIISHNNSFLDRLISTALKLNSDATFLIREVVNPKSYGVVEGEEKSDGVYKVIRVEEKPEKPATNLAIMGIYVFSSKIFDALKEVSPDKNDEIQLTDGIQKLIDWGCKVYAVKLREDELRLDIGTPETYIEALMVTSKLVYRCET